MPSKSFLKRKKATREDCLKNYYTYRDLTNYKTHVIKSQAEWRIAAVHIDLFFLNTHPNIKPSAYTEILVTAIVVNSYPAKNTR